MSKAKVVSVAATPAVAKTVANPAQATQTYLSFIKEIVSENPETIEKFIPENFETRKKAEAEAEKIVYSWYTILAYQVYRVYFKKGIELSEIANEVDSETKENRPELQKMLRSEGDFVLQILNAFGKDIQSTSPDIWISEGKKAKTVTDLIDLVRREISRSTLQGYSLVRSSVHFENQKFIGTQMSIYDMLDFDDQNKAEIKVAKNTIRDMEKYKIRRPGLVDLTYSDLKAIHAIQTLLSDPQHFENSKKLDGDNPFLYDGYVSVLKATPADYLDAYGVGKRKTSRGFWEYNANERNEAMKTLFDLGKRPHLIVYKRKYFVEGKEKIDRINTVRPLVQIDIGYKGLTEEEDRLLDTDKTNGNINQKLKVIQIKLSPIFFDQLDSHFVLKHKDYIKEIKARYPKTSKHFILFVDYIIGQAEFRRRKKERLILKINYRILAQKIDMKKYIDTRQWKRIRSEINKFYEQAKELEYLESFEISKKGKTKEIDILTLNPQKLIHSTQKPEPIGK